MVVVAVVAVVAAAAAGAVWLGRSRRAKPTPALPEPAGHAAGGRRGLKLDDVLIYGADELWLSGMLLLDDDPPIRLFAAPTDTDAQRWLMEDRADGRHRLLEQTAEVPLGPVPRELPVGGRLFTVRRRGRAAAEGSGSLSELRGPTDFAVLDSGGGRTLVVMDLPNGTRLALVGDPLHAAMADLLPGGDLR